MFNIINNCKNEPQCNTSTHMLECPKSDRTGNATYWGKCRANETHVMLTASNGTEALGNDLAVF